MNKSSSLLLQLYLHLLHFLIMNKSLYFTKKKKKRKKKEGNFQKGPWDYRALGSYFLGFFQKQKNKKNQSNKIFNSLKKFKISTFFKKKKSKFSIP